MPFKNFQTAISNRIPYVVHIICRDIPMLQHTPAVYHFNAFGSSPQPTTLAYTKRSTHHRIGSKHS